MEVVDLVGRVLAAVGMLLAVPTVGLALLVGVDEAYTAYALGNLRRFRRAAVSGRTAEGQLTPLSRTPCAWWKLSIMQWREEEGAGEWTEVWCRVSAETVEVIEGSLATRISAELVESELRTETGVKPLVRQCLKDGAQSVGARLRRLEALGFVVPERFHDGIVMERSVPAGIPIVAVGRLKRGILRRSLWGMGVNGVSTLELEEIRRRATVQARETWSMVRWMAVASAVLLGSGWGIVGLVAALSPDQ